MTYAAPFAGIRVVDLTQGLAGPEAGMLLAQYGADVIKVEPLGGDWSRNQGQKFGDFTDKTIANNRGKRSIALDLKSDAGKGVLRQLVEKADVFLEAFRPGVIQRLGFGYDTVITYNPGIIYLSVSGFSQIGPLSERPATDAVLQAYSGLMQVNKGSVDGLPHRVGIWPIDMISGLYAFQAISTALYAKREEPKGRFIDCSLMQSAAAIQAIRVIEYSVAGGEGLASQSFVGTFRTQDGWINLSVMDDKAWAKLCAAIERPDLLTDPRFAVRIDRYDNDVQAKELVQSVLETRSFEAWSVRLTDAGVLHERVNDYLDFLAHPHTSASNAVQWTDHPDIGRIPIPNIPGVEPAVDGEARSRAPRLGEHTREVLADLGLAAQEIAELLQAGVVGGN
ncbi:MAG: crotonobetainyl-CoA:carnitine CoA-transferase CaiB-like acyl-CoA transferase [Gammaproteobacteria bacterium]|jgi:crotonobetainyl-CoA:carnitine CoA-transferase CaiB-like acyl-CoA transferase